MIDVTDIKNEKRLAVHLLLWAGLYIFWVFVFQNTVITFSRTMQIEFCYLVFIAANYYFNAYYTIPQYLNKQKYVLFFLIGVAFLVVTAWLRAEVALFINAYFYNAPAAQIDFGRLYFTSILNIFVWTLCLVAVKIIIERIKFQQYALVIEKEKIKNELDFLRAQNNPHFLFNALNSVYFQIDKNNKEARDSLVRISEILRYQLYDCNTEKVSIDKELVFLKNYIELQKLRLDSNYNVAVEIASEVKGFIIAPLLIMPLVENAFKYVSHFTNKQNIVKVSLSYTNGVLICEVFNTFEKEQLTHKKNSGIGLKNLKRRLELLYPGRYEINIDSSEQSFSVKLMLKINED